MTFQIDNEEIQSQLSSLLDRHFSSSALLNAGHLINQEELSIIDNSKAKFDLDIGLNVVNSMLLDSNRPRNDDLIQYILAKSIHSLENEASAASDKEKIKKLNIEGLLLLSSSPNDELLALYLITIIIIKQGKANDTSLEVIKIINKNCLSNDKQIQFVNYQFLKELITFKFFRLQYLKNFNLANLINLLNLSSTSLNLQLKYTLIFIIWSFSFTPKLIDSREINLLIPILFTFAKDGIKEKVIRLSISSLINFATNEQFLKKYLLCNGLSILNSLSERKWSDDELKTDLDQLKSILNESMISLTTWDEYYDELKSLKFQWSPTHKSDEFWIDNCDKFKENNWKIVKEMIKLLENNRENDENQLYLNQSIVCFDISKLINLKPEILSVLSEIGAKTKIMTLMNSPNPNVKYEALKTTQLLVSKSI